MKFSIFSRFSRFSDRFSSAKRPIRDYRGASQSIYSNIELFSLILGYRQPLFPRTRQIHYQDCARDGRTLSSAWSELVEVQQSMRFSIRAPPRKEGESFRQAHGIQCVSVPESLWLGASLMPMERERGLPTLSLAIKYNCMTVCLGSRDCRRNGLRAVMSFGQELRGM